MSETQSKKTLQPSKIVWAVDPFTADQGALRSAAWCLRALGKSVPTQVKPVYVPATTYSEFPMFPNPSLIETLKNQGDEALQLILSRIQIPNVQPLHVLTGACLNTRDQVCDLISYARKNHADLIVLSTHGRTGVKRLFLGSFAETLSLLSDVPLFIVHPHWRRTPEFKTILFPTDFSPESRNAFSKVLRFAQERRSRVILFHKIHVGFNPVLNFAFSASQSNDRTFFPEIETRKQTAKEMAEQGLNQGVRVDIIFDHHPFGSLSDAILKKSDRMGCMIALSSQSGPVSSVLLGSTARQVIRRSLQPVWVVHQKTMKKNRSSSKFNSKRLKSSPESSHSQYHPSKNP